MDLYTLTKASTPRYGYEYLCNTRNVIHDTLTYAEEVWFEEWFGNYDEDKQLALLWVLRDLDTKHLYICEAYDTENLTAIYAYREVAIC